MSFDKIFDLTAGVYFNFHNIYTIRRKSTREKNSDLFCLAIKIRRVIDITRMEARTVVGRGKEGPPCDPGSELLLGGSARV